MDNSKILSNISRLLFPFVIMFGLYICVNGDSSVGGGFQGGVILASSYLIYYFIVGEHPFSLPRMLKIDKYIFILLPIVIALSFFTKGDLFTNFIPANYSAEIRRMYLVILNLLIGLKVSVGFASLFLIYIEEGNN